MTTLKFIEKDIFEVYPNEERALLCHVVNNQNAMGSGFVVPLMKMYPQVKSEYHDWFKEGFNYMHGRPFLGKNQYIHTHKDSYVVNMMAQTLGGERPLYYNALVNCMDSIVICDYKIMAPLFGCGLSKGNFSFIRELIIDCWVKKGKNVEIYWLPNLLPANVSPDMLLDYEL